MRKKLSAPAGGPAAMEPRDLLVSLLRSPLPGDGEEEWSERFGNELGRDLPGRGFDVSDLRKDAAPSAWYLKSVAFPSWSPAFAAFLLEGYKIDPAQAGPALHRLKPFRYQSSATEKVFARYEDLKVIADELLGLDPARVLLRLSEGAEQTPELITLFWAARRTVAQDFVHHKNDLLERDKRKSEELARQVARVGPILYLLAVSEGWETGDGKGPAAAKLIKLMEDSLAKLNEQRMAKGLPLAAWTAPDESSLQRWLEEQRSVIREPAVRPGRKKKVH
jgi:hypothetical protein